MAGGTDLLLDISQGRHEPVHTLVDVSRIPELQRVEERRGDLFVGAAAPLSQIVASPLVQARAMALVEAAALIGGPQVRNSATLGGNVAHALPAGDGTIALVALEAQAEVATPKGRQRLPIVDLFRGPGQSTLDPANELLVGFYLPHRTGKTGSAFRRVMRPQGVAIAILNLAVWLAGADDRIVDIHIAAGPSGPVPRRLVAAEAALRGHSFTEEALAGALEALLEEASFRTSRHRASIEYRQHLAGVLLRDTVTAAWERAMAMATS